jgi:hypothetical protein
MVATQAAVLAGFSFGAFGRDDWTEMQTGHRVVFANCCAASMSLNLAAVVISTFSSVLGPKMALLGKEGCTFRACELLGKYHVLATRMHLGGLFFFFLSCLDYGFLLFEYEEASLLCTQLIVAIGMIGWFMTTMFVEFQFEEEEFMDEDYGKDNAAAAGSVAKGQSVREGVHWENALTARTQKAPTSRKSKSTRGSSRGMSAPQPKHTALMSKKSSSEAKHDSGLAGMSLFSTTDSKLEDEVQAQRSKMNQMTNPRRLLKSGIVTKQGRNIGANLTRKWQPRYFEVYRDWLVYYASKEGPEKGRMCLFDTACEAEVKKRVSQGATSRAGSSSFSAMNSFRRMSNPLAVEFALEVTPTAQLKDPSLSEYISMPNALQIKSSIDCIYMDFLSEEERDEWADIITSCANNAKNAREKESPSSATTLAPQRDIV